MLDPFSLPFFQRGVIEVLLLAVCSGVLGTWIVLRGLAFFAHAVGTATFPGLVLADGLAFPAAIGAFGAALIVAALVGGLRQARRTGDDSVTALVLAAALALGIILASDVFQSQGRVDRLLFGSLLTIDTTDIGLALAAAIAGVAASLVLGPRWLATGFTAAGDDRSVNRAADLTLVVLIAFAAVAALAAVGALLTTAILVVPAATTRLFTDRLPAWQVATVVLASIEGVLGMWISYQLNAPPGAAIAVLAGSVFALVAIGRALAARRSRIAPALAVLALGALGVAGCGTDDGDASGDQERAKVVATTTQLGDMAREIGGDAVDVSQILRANADPHEYEPRPEDVEALSAADVVLVSGLGLDEWAQELIESSGTDARIVDVGASVPSKVPADGEEFTGDDPHWWHDPTNAESAVGTIESAMATAAQGAAGKLAARADSYRERLSRLDEQIRACVDQVPASERKIVTDHDAFGYFAKRYGIDVVGAVIPSQSTQAQASAGELADLARTIKDEGVKAVFPESSVNRRLADRIARETGASAKYTLYGDTLGPEGSPAATYLGMEAANANAIVQGITGAKESCDIQP